MDDETYEVLTQLALPDVDPISLQDFEKGDESLLRAKQNRSQVEYYFTCTPSLPLYILNNWSEVDLITYVDADLFFFSSPTPLFEELGTGSVAIIGHRLPEHLRHREIYGIYNVGWLSFRRDDSALACLCWWREKCIEWCYDREEDGRFADQKYLDDWPVRFQNVIVLEHKGANLAPWNLANYCLHILNGGEVVVDEDPLIFFHFHGLKKIRSWLYNPSWKGYGATPSMVLRRRIYIPYLQMLDDINSQLLAALDTNAISEDVRDKSKNQGRPMSGTERLVGRIRILPSVASGMLTGNYLFFVNGNYI